MTKTRERKWFERLIGYEFNYNGRGIILLDIFYYEDENGKITGTGYEMKWSDDTEDYGFICDYATFKEYISQTDYPKK